MTHNDKFICVLPFFYNLHSLMQVFLCMFVLLTKVTPNTITL